MFVFPVQTFVAPTFAERRAGLVALGIPPLAADFILVGAITALLLPCNLKLFQVLFETRWKDMLNVL